MWLLNIFFTLLQALASAIQLFEYFRPRRIQGESPFVVVPIDELMSNLPSPLNVIPERIERGLQEDVKPGIHIFLGTSGVGKTREAAEFANRLSNVSGAKVVYLAKGYIGSMAPLPKQKDVKRVIVMIDDYDWRFESAASESFLEREAAYREALVNLRSLYDRLKTQLDLHAFIVTINQHRLPVCSSDINKILPECKLTEIPLVTPEEFSDFILAAATSLDVQVSDEVLKLLVELCNGRFDSVATFLSSFNKGYKIQKTEIKKFSDNLKSIWLLFKDQLSDEQKNVYNKIKILKDFKLTPHVEYVTELLQLDCQYLKEKEVRRVITSIWPIKNSQALVYDGQFGPPEQTLDLAKLVISTVLNSARLRYNDRYAFQEETKIFASMLTEFPPTKIHLQMLRKLCKWYPRDRYFAYLLALAYKSHGKYIRGILAIYRILNQRDIREIVFGKWIGIKLHLLLADLYQCIDDKKSKKYWERHKYIEKEFKLAASLADPDFPDFSIKDYGEPIQIKGTPDSNVNIKQLFDNEHKELGFDIPPMISIDKKHLCAMVHDKYAKYLFGEFHREYDAIKHEEIVIKLIPEYGGTYLNCAQACLRIGDTKRALTYAEQAGLLSSPLNPVFYEYMVAHIKFAAFYDFGDIPNARKWLNKCIELVDKKPLCDNLELKKPLEYHKSNPNAWEEAKQFALRQKEFGQKLIYSIPSLNIELCFPGDWKIDNEHFLGDFLNVTFAPTATWDETAQCPYDASVNVIYSRLQGKTAGCVEALRTQMLTSKQFGKIESILAEGPKTISEITFCIWNFKIAGSWPKEGILITFISPTCEILIHAMYQTCGKHIFEPVLTSVVETFTQNLLHNPNWKLKK
jgi:tetratricopeptide (TPR) repeat protein